MDVGGAGGTVREEEGEGEYVGAKLAEDEGVGTGWCLDVWDAFLMGYRKKWARL